MRAGIRNVLLGTFAAWGFGMILWALLDYDAGYLRMLTALGFLSGVLGTAAVRRGAVGQWLCMGVTMVLAILGGVWQGPRPWGSMYALVCGILIYLAMMGGGYGFFVPLGICSLLIQIIGLLAGGQILGIVFVILSLLLTLDGFRERSQRRGQLENQVDQMSPGPAGFTEHSFLLMALFFVVCILGAIVVALILMALFSGIMAMANHLAGNAMVIWQRIYDALERFREWFWSLFQDIGPEPMEPEEQTERTVLYGTPNAIPSIILIIALIIGGGALATGGVVYVFHARKVFRRRELPGPRDYEDTVERLERPARKPRGQRSGRQRRKEYQGAMKIRFAFQQLMRRRQAKGCQVYSKTPNELREDVALEDDLIDAYNQVRYGDKEPTDEELSAAEAYLKSKDT